MNNPCGGWHIHCSVGGVSASSPPECSVPKPRRAGLITPVHMDSSLIIAGPGRVPDLMGHACGVKSVLPPY